MSIRNRLTALEQSAAALRELTPPKTPGELNAYVLGALYGPEIGAELAKLGDSDVRAWLAYGWTSVSAATRAELAAGTDDAGEVSRLLDARYSGRISTAAGVVQLTPVEAALREYRDGETSEHRDLFTAFALDPSALERLSDEDLRRIVAGELVPQWATTTTSNNGRT